MNKWGLSEAMGMPIEEGEHHWILKCLKVVFFDSVRWWVFLLVAKKAVNFLAAQVRIRIQLVHNTIRHSLLVHLL